LDLGVNLFDTADCYGLGQSEQRLGKALKGKPQALVASKFGVRIGADGRTFYDNSPEWLDEALDASLLRLGRDHIDLYQVHYWDLRRPLRETFEQLEDKRRAGKIRWYGVSNCTPDMIGSGETPQALVSCSFEASLAERRWEAAFDAFDAAGVTGLSWGSLGQGLLTGKYNNSKRPAEGDRRNRPTYPKFHGEALSRNLGVVEAIKALQSSYPGRSIGQIAVRWLLDRRPACAAIVGMKNPQQVGDNIGALGWRLAPDDVAHLDRLSDPRGI
jgi:aryl-alcohol dehydrogenase-like predicted oxidoreductase